MRLALIRHGQTDWNLALRMQGRTDVPLNDTGRAQARAAVPVLAALAADDEPWEFVVSSTLGRARESAQILADGLGIPFAGTDEDLVEQEFGEAEGVLVAELFERWPVRGTIPGMEPDVEVGPRGFRALERLAAAHPDARVLVVAHGTLIRHVLAEITGVEASRYPRLVNLSSSLVDADASGWTVRTAGGVPIDVVLAAAESENVA